MIRLIFLFCACFAWDVAAQPAERFVTNPQELKAAIAAAGPGEAIVMANGTWQDIDILFEAEGLPGDTITLRAETPGQVRLSGRSMLRIAGSYLKVDGLFFTDGWLFNGHVIQFRKNTSVAAHHSRLTNTAIIHYNPDSDLLEYKWVSLYGTHNRVDHSHFEGKTHDGATLVVWLENQPNYHRIDNNYFGPRPDLGKNGGETIRIGTSDWSLYPSHTVVERNLFDRCDGEIEIISNKSGDNVFRHNTFLESAGTLTLRHGDRALIEGNFFIGNNKSNTGGVRIIGEDHVVVNNYFENLRGTGYRSPISIVNGVPNSPLNRYFQVKRALIAHNTIVNSYAAFEIGSGRSSEQSLPPEDVVIANNIVSNDERPRINMVIQRDTPIDLTWSANIMYGPPLGVTEPEGVLVEDPLMVKGDDGQWRPSAESPAKDEADLSFSPVTEDVEGRPRPAEARAIGAHEIEGGAPARRPLTKTDVGVSYSTSTSIERPLGGGVGLLLESYPNPFHQQALIGVTLDRASHASVEVHDALGRRVAVLADRHLPQGRSEFEFGAAGLAAGLYFVTIQAGGERAVQALVHRGR